MASRKEYEMLFQLNAKSESGFATTFSKAQQQLLSMQKEIQALNRTQADISAYQKQQQAVENSRAKMELYQTQLNNLKSATASSSVEEAKLANEIAAKEAALTKATAAYDRENAKLNEMGNALREAGVDTNNLGKSSQELTAQVDKLKSSQEQAAGSAQDFGSSTESAFDAVQGAIVAAGVATLVREIADAYRECIGLAADFEETMSTVEALSGASDGDMRKLNSFAKELGATTKFTAIESGEAMTYMAMAGWDAQEMMSGMNGVLNLAAASGEDLAMTSDIVTDNLTAFGLKASDTAHFSDVLAAAATNSNTSVSIMGETFKNCAALAGALDYSIEDVAVAVGLMANAGIKGSHAGIALKNVFNGLLSGVTLTSKAFGEVEYSAINSDGTMKSFAETLTDLRGYFDQMTGAEKLQNAEALAGQRAMAGFVSIMNSTDEDFESLTKNINNCSGAAEKMAKIKLDNLNGQLTLMNSASDALKTTLGEQFAGELRTLAGLGTSILGDINGFVKANPALIKGVMTFAGVLGAVIAGLLTYASVVKVIKALELASLFSVAGPAMIAVAAVAGLTAGIVAITSAYNDAQIAARRYGEEATEAAEKYKQVTGEADALQQHIDDWKALSAIISSGKAPVEEVNAAKEKLKENEQWLIDNYGIYLDSDGKVSDEEIASLEERNKELRETARLQAEIALSSARDKYIAANNNIPGLKQRRDALDDEVAQLVKEQSVLQKVSAEWQNLYSSDAYKQADYADQSKMRQEALGNINAQLSEKGLRTYSEYEANHGLIGETLENVNNDVRRKVDELEGYNGQLLEYLEYEKAYKQAKKDIIDMNIKDVPTDSLKEFAEAAKTIGEQAADAELGSEAMRKYADELTAAAHAAGLLPENQKISFDADGAIRVLEEVEDGVDALDGQTATVSIDADSNSAIVKIGNTEYKVLEYDSLSGIATLSADGTSAFGEINLTTGEVHKFNAEEAKAILDANKDGFDEKIKDAKTELINFPSTKTVTINTIWSGIKGVFGFASGTANAPRGVALVGEKGPELVYMGGGETVIPAPETEKILKLYGNSGIAGYADGTPNASEYVEIVSMLPLMQSLVASMHSFETSMVSDPVSANSSNYGETHIIISPTFTVNGGSDDLESRLQEFSDVIVGNVKDALEEAGIDAKRGAYV